MKRYFSSLIILNFIISGLFCTPEHLILQASNPETDLFHEENTPLFWGNPSDAVTDSAEGNNYLLEKSNFTLSYNNYSLGPNWVGWHLCSNDLGDTDRSNKFTADKELPAEWYAVKQKDYQYNMYGFDRGHICPSADRTSTKEANQQTFLMTNMLPQAPDCNRIVWKALEDYERKLAVAGNELYIFAGGFGRGGTGAMGYFEEIPVSDTDENRGTILVPEFCWKIIMVLPEGEDDFNRVTAETQIIAVCIPNAQGCGQNGSWEQYECSVDYIEQQTGCNFFELLDNAIEDILEM